MFAALIRKDIARGATRRLERTWKYRIQKCKRPAEAGLSLAPELDLNQAARALILADRRLL